MPRVSGRGVAPSAPPFRGGGYTWVVGPEQAFGELAEEYTRAIHRSVRAIADRWAPEIQNWMKENAPWTDRTGNARQGLYTEVQDVANVMVSIILSHGVDYGLFLEVSNQGRYAIINPAIDHFGPKVWADVKRIMA